MFLFSHFHCVYAKIVVYVRVFGYVVGMCGYMWVCVKVYWYVLMMVCEGMWWYVMVCEGMWGYVRVWRGCVGVWIWLFYFAHISLLLALFKRDKGIYIWWVSLSVGPNTDDYLLHEAYFVWTIESPPCPTQRLTWEEKEKPKCQPTRFSAVISRPS